MIIQSLVVLRWLYCCTFFVIYRTCTITDDYYAVLLYPNSPDLPDNQRCQFPDHVFLDLFWNGQETKKYYVLQTTLLCCNHKKHRGVFSSMFELHMSLSWTKSHLSLNSIFHSFLIRKKYIWYTVLFCRKGIIKA